MAILWQLYIVVVVVCVCVCACVCVCVFEIYYSHNGLWPIREKELQARGLAVVEVRLDVLGDPVWPLLR